jgi:hypothetical protein
MQESPPVRSGAGLWALAELFALTGLVIAQPVLDVTGRSPDMFLFRRADRLDILALVAGVTVLPALAIWAMEMLVGLVSGTARRLLHLAMVTGLLVVLAVEVVKATTGLRGPGLAAVAAAAGLGGGVLYASMSWPRLWLRFLTPAPLVFALLFLLASPTSALVRPERTATGPGPPVATTIKDLPPVVMVLFDEFPLRSLLDAKGRIDKRVYPNFAELAGQSTWYRNATGVSGFTPWALPAMLTGNYPDGARAPSYTEYPDNLFTLFGRSYDVTSYETLTQLCPPRQCAASVDDDHQTGLRGIVGDSARVLRQLLQPYDAAFDPALFADQTRPRTESGPRSEETAVADFRFKQAGYNQPARFNDFLAGLRPSQRPTLHFLHLLLPHAPWRYLPSGNEYNFRNYGAQFRSDLLPAPVIELAHRQHLLQVAYTDRLVGQVIDKLKAENLWDRSLVVMGADHGTGWTAGEPSRVLGRNAPDLLWVPQFIKAPGQADGVVDDRNWEQVDLLPTVADLAGIQVPWRTDGRSQTGEPARTRTDKWWYDILGHRQVVDGPAGWAQVRKGATDTLVRGSEGVRGLYRFGPAADLVYRTPASAGPIGGAPATAVLDDRRPLGEVRPGSGIVPALVSGRLASPPPPGATVLVAVNGTIGGGSRLFPGRRGEPAVRFAAITPDFLWRPGPGRPQLQLYLADGGDRPHLQPVSVAA